MEAKKKSGEKKSSKNQAERLQRMVFKHLSVTAPSGNVMKLD